MAMSTRMQDLRQLQVGFCARKAVLILVLQKSQSTTYLYLTTISVQSIELAYSQQLLF